MWPCLPRGHASHEAIRTCLLRCSCCQRRIAVTVLPFESSHALIRAAMPAVSAQMRLRCPVLRHCACTQGTDRGSHMLRLQLRRLWCCTILAANFTSPYKRPRFCAHRPASEVVLPHKGTVLLTERRCMMPVAVASFLAHSGGAG